MKSRSRRIDFTGYLFLLPYIILFTFFLILPLAYGLWLSFMRYELTSPEAAGSHPATFVGLANYREALADSWFRQSFFATLRFVGMTCPATLILSLLIALAISTIPDRRQQIYRLAIFLPTMITISVAGLVWRWFYAPEFGVFNAFLAHFGVKIPWLTDTHWAMKSIVIMTLWWTVGGPVIILLAGIRQIPDAYYEAAAIDGAVGWRRTFHITLPSLRPVLLFVVVLNVIGAFQVFGQPYVITTGLPERSTEVLLMYIYDVSFNNFRLGYGAAMSWILFLVIAIFSLIQFRLLREK
ncbi:MAG TPA: sugar ABC transporter permease [Tepidisphaeraceae bacterium]|jgi:multiple sugar transport system permease protein|nr:sugar ABC transporter permease [Tepidisphaeraceae bacterium]